MNFKIWKTKMKLKDFEIQLCLVSMKNSDGNNVWKTAFSKFVWLK